MHFRTEASYTFRFTFIGVALEVRKGESSRNSSRHFGSLRSQLLSHLLWQLTYHQCIELINYFKLPALEFIYFCNSTSASLWHNVLASFADECLACCLQATRDSTTSALDPVHTVVASYLFCSIIIMHSKLHKGNFPFSLSRLCQQKLP